MSEIYTLGHTQNYRRAFEAQTPEKPMMKIGPFEQEGQPYFGGIAFRSAQEAVAWAKANEKAWTPWKLSGNWETDTYKLENEDIYRINKDLLILGEVTLEKRDE